MNRLLLVCALAACSSTNSGGDDQPGADASGSGGGGQRVVECNGMVQSGAPSNCPHGDCDESGGDRCTAYASWVPGSTTGVCNAGETGSYGVLFKDASDASKFFYEVVVCSNGSAMLHACVSGFHTDPAGYDGQPGYVCS